VWDYLVRILKAEDVPRRPSTPDVPHAADAPHGVRSSTEGEPQAAAEFEALPHATAEPVFCPLCHVRMRHERWHNAEAYLCPECNGAFLSEAALKELLGAIVDLQGDAKEPLIYTPHGLRKGPAEPHRSDQA
jgi:hypothetical protein